MLSDADVQRNYVTSDRYGGMFVGKPTRNLCHEWVSASYEYSQNLAQLYS